MLSRTFLRSKATGSRALSTTVVGDNDGDSSNNYAYLGGSVLAGILAYSFAKKKSSESWLFRDDIGSPNGIKGYEE
jgi:ubiquinol-cytochrome c reductase cytochrome c1 subunit